MDTKRNLGAAGECPGNRQGQVDGPLPGPRRPAEQPLGQVRLRQRQDPAALFCRLSFAEDRRGPGAAVVRPDGQQPVCRRAGRFAPELPSGTGRQTRILPAGFSHSRFAESFGREDIQDWVGQVAGSSRWKTIRASCLKERISIPCLRLRHRLRPGKIRPFLRARLPIPYLKLATLLIPDRVISSAPGVDNPALLRTGLSVPYLGLITLPLF